jgi:GTPase SAR1 family protein
VGVEFGAKTIQINQNNIKLQIWDTVIYTNLSRQVNKVLNLLHEDIIVMQLEQ